MALKDYSTTPANNNSAPPNGAPEGMLAASVNDTMRQMMADIKGGVPVGVTTKANMTALDITKLSADVQIQMADLLSSGDGAGGLFVWRAGDQSAQITADPQGGEWIAPDSASTGSSGAYQRSFIGPVYVRWFGAVGDGATDDSAAISAACNHGTVVYFSPGSYKIDTAVVVSSPVHLFGLEGSSVLPSLGLGGGKVFAFETDDVIVENMTVDGTGETFTPATANTYIFFGGDGTTKYYNHIYRNNNILTCSFSDGNSGATSSLVTHGIYVDNVDDVVIEDNIVDVISGAAVFLRKNHNLSVRNNRFEDTLWYSLQMTFDIKHFVVENNSFLSGTSAGVYWGGGINIVSDTGELPVSNGLISTNYFTGTYSYGAVMRLQSPVDVEATNNVLELCTVGSLGTEIIGIGATTRGVSGASKSAPCKSLNINNNTLYGCDTTPTKQTAIKVDNQWNTATPAEDIRIYDNKIYSDSASSYWGEGILIHGFTGGVDNGWIENNHIEVLLENTSTAGGIVLVATDADGTVQHVNIGGNYIEDIGTPAGSYQVGISAGAFSDNVNVTKTNTIKNMFYGVRTLTNSGPSLDKLDDNIYIGNTTDELFGVALTYYARFLTASATYDPPSLADGAQAVTDITITGAAVGEFTSASFSLDLQGITVTSYVRAVNTVEVVFQNESGGVIDLASGTLTARLFR